MFKTAIILFNQDISNGEFYFNSCVREVIRNDYTVIHPTTWDDYKNIDQAQFVEKIKFAVDTTFLFVDFGVTPVMVNVVEAHKCDPFAKEIRIEINTRYFGLNLLAILKDVSERTKIHIDLIRSRTRDREVVEARQFFCKRARELTRCSLAVIGAEIGRDHATVLHSIKTVNEIIQVRETYEELFEAKMPKRKVEFSRTVSLEPIENKAILIGKSPIKVPPVKLEGAKFEYQYIRPMSGYIPHQIK